MAGHVQSRVRQVAEAKGLRSAYDLQTRAQLFPSVAGKLWRNEVKRFSLETLTKLCNALNCKAGDLLVVVKD